MTSREINEMALDLLSMQDWINAQNLLFENAKNNPSHETYNNLGHYLITEGLVCKNGTFKNAQKLGFKYLLKAAKIKDTVVNLCAIVNAYNYAIRTASAKEKRNFYECSCVCLRKALEIEYSNELEYNHLSYLFMLDSTNSNILTNIRKLIKTFESLECIELYFELLRIHSLKHEGLQCIERYKGFLNEESLLIFYADMGLFENGFSLCESATQQFAGDKVLASSILECCINTGHIAEANIYAQRMLDVENDIQYDGKKNWNTQVFDNLNFSTTSRKSIISNYRITPQLITPCCYFGCKKHKTNWL